MSNGIGVPDQVLAHGRDFLVAQRGAVHLVAALQVRRALADDGLAADQGRTVRCLGLAIAASTAATSWPSTCGITFQP
jgi:hypothetical protein